MSGRHRPDGIFSHRAVRLPLIFVGAISLIGAVSVVVKTVVADADGCSANGLRLSIAADPAIAPVIGEIGQRWSATRPAVGEDCVRIEVTAVAAADLANSLGTYAGGTVDVAALPAPTPSASDLPAVWIPDSSYWLGRLRGIDRDLFEGEPTSVAASPVLLALPEEAAQQSAIGRDMDAAALKGLLTTSAIKLGAVEPRRDTAGMVGAMMISDAVVASERNLPDLVGAYRARTTAVSDTSALWQLLRQGVGAVIASEHAVLAYNNSAPTAPVAAVSLSEAPTLDFPYTTLSGQPRQLVVAADLFRAALLLPEYQGVFASHGLRSPDGLAAAGFPTGHGITAAQVHVQPLVDLTKVKSAMTVWVAAKMPSRVIALVDGTSSMQKPMSGGGSTQVRMEVLRNTATFGLQLFTNESQLGLWAFAGPGHQQLVPLDTLNEAQRAKLTFAVQHAAPQPTDTCALYQTIIEGYRALLNGYDPLLSNTLVVFTDSRDTTGVEIRAVQRELEKLSDVTKPIRVVLLGIGPDVNLAELQSIIDTTGGAAFQVQNPSDVQGIFLKALLT